MATLTLNLATQFLYTFENMSIQFLVLENIGKHIFSLLILTEYEKLCWNTNLATLSLYLATLFLHFWKYHQSIPRPSKRGNAIFELSSVARFGEILLVWKSDNPVAESGNPVFGHFWKYHHSIPRPRKHEYANF